MFYKKNSKPEIDEIILCTVKRVTAHSVFVEFDEYNTTEGMIHISEIAPGRIRNIRDYVKEGKKIICKVLNINKQTGNIDLSLRRVTLSQRIEKSNQLKQEAKAEKLLFSVAQKLKIVPEEIYKKVALKLIEKYGSLFVFFETLVANGKSIMNDISIQENIQDELYNLAKEKMRPPEVSIKGTLKISSYKPEGIDDIKKVLENLIKNKIKIIYLGAPNYKLEVVSDNYKKAEKILNNAIELAEKEINTFGGTLTFEKDD
jgi:translation initiation factor 2 subunit 1